MNGSEEQGVESRNAALRASRIEAPEQPRFADAATEDLLTGGRTLRRAFLQTPLRFAGRDTALIRLDEREPPVVLLRNGFAYKSCALADGRRAILDLLVPGDIIGLDHIILASPNEEVTAVNRIAYHAMEPAEMRALMADRCAALRIVALLAEARCRSDRLAAMIGRLDAQARLAAFLLGIHDRLRQRGLTNQPPHLQPTADAGADRRSSRPDPGARQPHLAADARGAPGAGRPSVGHHQGSGRAARSRARSAAAG
jgi:hypothetical protein